jgi:small conductance mechanosensitive channel
MMDWFPYTPETLLDFATPQGAIALAVVVALVAMSTSAILSRVLRRSRWVMGKLERKVDATVVRYVIHGKSLLIALAALIVYVSLVPELRGLLGTLLAGAGVLAIVVGFAAKSTLSNLISGMAIAVYRPVRIGDKIDIEGEYGTVEDITLRHTIVRTWEHKRLVIPNERLDTLTLVNHSIIDPKMLCRVEIGVSYDTDIDLARRVMLDEAARCPHLKADGAAPWMRVVSHGEFAIGLRLYAWVPDVDELWLCRFWLLEQIKKRFDAEGIEIPFPYRTLVYKKDLSPPRR